MVHDAVWENIFLTHVSIHFFVEVCSSVQVDACAMRVMLMAWLTRWLLLCCCLAERLGGI